MLPKQDFRKYIKNITQEDSVIHKLMNRLINSIMFSLMLGLSPQLYGFVMAGIYATEYQGKAAFTDDKGKVFLVATVIDMGGGDGSASEGEALSIDQVRENIGHKINNEVPDQVVKTPLKGIYELYYAKRVFYIDGSARYVFRNGQLVTSTGKNLTTLSLSRAAKLQAKKNLRQLAQIAENEMLVYPASAERSHITIFTDVDCPFCQRIHKDISTYTDAGISVKYLFYPRAGQQSSAYKRLEQVWCSDNRHVALDKAFEKGGNNQSAVSKSCDNPVGKHLQLAESFKLMGTPAIFLQDGSLVLGYQSPEALISLLGK